MLYVCDGRWEPNPPSLQCCDSWTWLAPILRMAIGQDPLNLLDSGLSSGESFVVTSVFKYKNGDSVG